MNPSRTFFGLVACHAALLAACGAGAPGDPLDDDALEVPLEPAWGGTGTQEPPAGTNGMLPSCFWAHGSQQALRALGGAALDQGGGAISSIPLDQVPADCRHVIGHAVECALSPEQSLSDPVSGDVYEGWWGLAPSWSSGALTTDGRRDVTACMIQRLNISGAHVPVLLEGPNSAIVEDEAYDSSYPIVESTAFGDLFSSDVPLFSGLPAFNAFVCWEGLLPESCGLPLLEQRICDDALLCGLTTLGPCGLSCAANGPYWKCRLIPFSPYWTQTVRVQLQACD
jgi:hypothetical protein